ncbi:uncharacterized protein LOC124896732 [Capsicum annuum]|uniref:uncharacterized protein LOC124896732 n=1 Tax=Capsicum annuum TaxID=4072 RepID=UPI001FB1154D|nr:uncharacterized protein LOC124896732 [Capsicum annuum]
MPNEKNELVTMRPVTGWRVCKDYMKLNAWSQKDHFSMSFMDQMLDKQFIKDVSKIASPLFKLLEKKVTFNFEDVCKKDFESLKEKFVSAPIIVSLDWSSPFEVMCDISRLTLGSVLGQRKEKISHSIYYASKALNPAQKNYTVMEQELLTVVFAFEKKGTENQVVDHLSRLEEEAMQKVAKGLEIDDNFPDKQIFTASEDLIPWLHLFPGKLKSRWHGPFTMTKVGPYGDLELKKNGVSPFKVNGHRVKHYMGNAKVVKELAGIDIDEV